MPDIDTSRMKLTYRSWRDDVSAEWARFRGGLTRDNIVSNLKTLAWVVPLTLLIWIWAEREQVQPLKDVTVPFELISVDPNRVIRNKSGDSNLVLELSGPQARLHELKNKLSGGIMPRGLRLEVPTTFGVNQDHVLRTIDLVNNQQIFRDYGVIVGSVQPARIEVSIDELVDREAKIVVPPTVTNVDATFDPPTVKIRGPLGLLNRAAQAQRGQLVVYAVADAWPRTPGAHQVPNVVLIAPDELKDDRVRINDAQAKISATLDVRQADKTYRWDSMPVSVDWPFGSTSKYDVVIERPAVQNVTLVGPPEVIDAMQKPDFEPQPKARLVITRADLLAVGERRTKVVQYDLPKGVDVSPEDMKKTVEFRISERAANEAP
jgi:hypothetical protein